MILLKRTFSMRFTLMILNTAGRYILQYIVRVTGMAFMLNLSGHLQNTSIGIYRQSGSLLCDPLQYAYGIG